GFVAGLDRHRPDILAFISMIDRRKRLHREITAALPATRSDVAATVIPSLSAIEQMAARRTPVIASSPRGIAARCYRDLWQEAKARAKLAAPRRRDGLAGRPATAGG